VIQVTIGNHKTPQTFAENAWCDGSNNAEMVAAHTDRWTEANDMMKHHVRTLTSILACATVSLSAVTMAQTSTGSPSAIGTPEKVESRLGTLEYKDGVPVSATVQTAYDNLDFMHAVQVHLNAFAGVSTYAIRESFLSIGADDNQVVISTSDGF